MHFKPHWLTRQFIANYKTSTKYTLHKYTHKEQNTLHFNLIYYCASLGVQGNYNTWTNTTWTDTQQLHNKKKKCLVRQLTQHHIKLLSGTYTLQFFNTWEQTNTKKNCTMYRNTTKNKNKKKMWRV